MSATPLHVEVHGERGPYLLLVHGFLSSRSQWRPNLESLSKVCRPVVVELLGHGRSAAPDDLDAYRAQAYLDAFETIRESLGAERWFVCGQSFGAGITIRYALRWPERVIGQIITNSISALSPPSRMEPPEQRAANAKALLEAGSAAIEALPFHPNKAQRFPPHVHREMLEDARRIAPHAVANSLLVTRAELCVTESLGDLKVPTLIVNGLWEKTFQPLRDLAVGRIPGCEVVDLEGGHSINIEAAEAFNAAVIAFVERHAAAS